MSHNQFSLLATRRFLPLFVTQFLGAFNDNVFKNAINILFTFIIADQLGMDREILVALAAGVFIFPFFLFSATAGKIADGYDKAKLIRILKGVEIVLMLTASLAFYIQNAYFLLGVLFLMGTQSTFFGPLKYSILPDHLRENELIGGNALVEAATFIAILLGTILGGALILTDAGPQTISLIVLAIAVAGLFSSFAIPTAPSSVPVTKPFRFSVIKETWEMMCYAASQRSIFLAILGISWFWFVGAVFLAQFSSYTYQVIGGNEHIINMFLGLFSIGIGLGSLLCNRILKGSIHATFVPLSAFAMSLFIFDFYYTSQTITPPEGYFIGVKEFFQSVVHWHIAVDLLLIAIAGGVYIVPLYAIVQSQSQASHRSRMIASNNIMNALFMSTAMGLTVWLISLGYTVGDIFFFIAIANIAVGIIICRLLPSALIRSILRILFRLFYRAEVRGIKHFEQVTGPRLIVANHMSFLDAALIAAFVNTPLSFAVNTHIAQRWWMKIFLRLGKALPLDPANPMSLKTLIHAAKNGETVVIFPEGRITLTGSLMKIYEGPAMVALKAQAEIIPIRIDGAQYSPFSRLKGKLRTRLFPKITLDVLPPRRLTTEKIGKEMRAEVGKKLYELMKGMMFETSRTDSCLYDILLDAKNTHGRKHPIIEDVMRNPLNYQQFINRSQILGRHITSHSSDGEYIGVLLPNMVSTAVVFFALHGAKRIPVMLNFSTGEQAIVSACNTAKLRVVYTSRRFIEMSKLESLVDAIEQSNVHVIYLEDAAKSLSFFDKIIGMLKGRFISRLSHPPAPDEAAVVLFTSGSEGTPKGVVLSHRNILSNIRQLASCVDFGPSDIVFNALPMFHSFGLTGGTLLPVLSGIKTFFYPSPLHYRVVPQLVYDTNATVMFGTDTFLSGYARFAHSYDFYSIRYVFAGAEKLKDETRRLWAENFGIRIFEGYGATETSPVIATNTPMQYKAGTVGPLLPAMEYRLEDIPGIDTGGRLWVKGPNIMAGYLLADQPGVLVPPAEDWYDTGDIVSIDEDGFLRIEGRAKRFAKVAGEMVSLTAVEQAIAELWPDHMHAVVAKPDEKKGEQLVLVTTHPEASRDIILTFAKERGMADISVPKQVVIWEEIPLLGTGKIDYVSIVVED